MTLTLSLTMIYVYFNQRQSSAAAMTFCSHMKHSAECDANLKALKGTMMAINQSQNSLNSL